MVKIKLKDFYPFEKDDVIIEVSDELAATLYAFERQEASYIRKVRRHQAYYSLWSSLRVRMMTTWEKPIENSLRNGFLFMREKNASRPIHLTATVAI